MILRNRFVVDSIAKASHNVAFAWQRHLNNEIGLNNFNNITSMPMKSIKLVDKIWSDNIVFLKKLLF